jgi:cation diffusion facilitator family transporter
MAENTFTEAQTFPEAEKRKTRLSYIEGWLSVVINTILFGLKYWVGITSGSIAVMADAWHTLSDSLTSVVVLVGTKASKKSADEKHPFGHGRAELIASIVIGVLLAVVGFNFFVAAIDKLRNRETAEYDWLVVLVFMISVVVKEGLAQFAIRAGRKTGSKPLLADGWHHRSDAIASLIIVIGVFIGDYYWWIDGVMGILVALLILYASFEIMKQSIDPLIGERPDDELIHKLESIVGSVIDQQFDLHRIHIHRYGATTELTFHIQYLSQISFEDAHNRATVIEQKLKQQLNIDATIHYEPAE